MMRFVRQALAVMLMTAAVAAVAADDKLTLEQVIAKHLASIGTPEALAKAKTRVAEGKSKFEIVNAGGYIEGKVTVVSQAGNSRLVLKYPNPDYPGEDMITDGNKVHVYGRPQRSALGFFIYNQSTALLTEGLFEGTLSTAWPLLDPKRHSAKLTYNGLKTIDGQQLHEVRYEPKKRTDLDIRLYFSKEDFRHVLTIAKLTLSPRLSTSGEVANASQQEIRYRVEERFSNFAQFDGMTFPTTFQIRYDLEGQRQADQRYTNTFNDVVNNVSLDPKTFEMK
jgi:outer membrane lipoprotein-sorting protein